MAPPSGTSLGGPSCVGCDEARHGYVGQVRLELVGHGGQLRRQPGRLVGGRRRADRQPDEAAQDVGQLPRLGLAAPQPGMVLERRRPGVGGQHGAKSTAGLSAPTFRVRGFGRARPFSDAHS